MQEETKQLNPVVITDITISDQVFIAADHMRQVMDTLILKDYFYKRVLQSDDFEVSNESYTLSEADDLSHSGYSDSINYEFSSPYALLRQNQISPSLGSLRRSNVEQWNYEVIMNEWNDDELVQIIGTSFIAPSNLVNHKFFIWLQPNKNLIHKIEYHYQWTMDHVLSNDRKNSTSTYLRRMNGEVQFNGNKIILLSAEFEFETCEAIRKQNCTTSKFFHQLNR